jgi:hypothetical protein
MEGFGARSFRGASAKTSRGEPVPGLGAGTRHVCCRPPLPSRAPGIEEVPGVSFSGGSGGLSPDGGTLVGLAETGEQVRRDLALGQLQRPLGRRYRPVESDWGFVALDVTKALNLGAEVRLLGAELARPSREASGAWGEDPLPARGRVEFGARSPARSARRSSFDAWPGSRRDRSCAHEPGCLALHGTQVRPEAVRLAANGRAIPGRVPATSGRFGPFVDSREPVAVASAT